MAITNTKVFPKHLDRDINAIFFDDFITYPNDYPDVAVVGSAAPGNHYTEAELSGLGHLKTKKEGDSITFDLPVEGHEKTVYWETYALGFQITAEMAADDQTGNFKKMPQKLAKSAAIKPDIVFFNNNFNNGFTGTVVGNYNLSWDGQHIFDTDHTELYTGLATIANEPATAGSLSETTLQAGFEYFWNLTDEAGMPMVLTPDILLVPTELTWVVSKLQKQGLIINSANNDINTVSPQNGIVGWRPKISRFLTSATAWFLLSKERDHRLEWKQNASLESADDFYTGNALFKVTERFQAYTMAFKPSYGNPGA